MKVSIIVPAKNEEKYIENTLISIKNQSYKEIETIVVPNGCTDKTEEIAKKYADKVISLSDSSPNKSRNAGAKNCSGNLLVFLDADTRLAKDAIATLVNIIEKKKKTTNKLFIGTLKTLPDERSTKAIVFSFIKNTARLFRASSPVIFCERDLFENVNGFDETLQVGKHDDGEFVRRASKLGKFRCINKSYALTSMRRYEKNGYLNTIKYWTFFNKDKEYPEIR